MLLILAATGSMLVGERLFTWAGRHLGPDGMLPGVWTLIRYPVAIALLTITTAVAYSVLPNHHRFRWFTPGAGVAVVLWILLSLGFQLFLDNFGRYNLLYGGLAAVIVLLLYLWLCSIILLSGGIVNAVIERAIREARGPTSS